MKGPTVIKIADMPYGSLGVSYEDIDGERREVLYRRCSEEFEARLRAVRPDRPHQIGAYRIGIAQGMVNREDPNETPRFYQYNDRPEPVPGMECNASCDGRALVDMDLTHNLIFFWSKQFS